MQYSSCPTAPLCLTSHYSVPGKLTYIRVRLQRGHGWPPPGLSSTNSYNVIMSHVKRIFYTVRLLYRGEEPHAPSIGMALPLGLPTTLPKLQKRRVTLKLCINHEEKTCENSDYLPKMERKSGEKLYCVANAYIQILFSGK